MLKTILLNPKTGRCINKFTIVVIKGASHLKAIAVDKGGRALLKIANVGQDAAVVDVNDKDAFISAAKTRQWDRGKIVRTLA